MIENPESGAVRSVRGRVSDAMIVGAFDRAHDADRLDAELASLPADAPGAALAQRAVASARRRESVLLWLGFRLRPRT